MRGVRLLRDLARKVFGTHVVVVLAGPPDDRHRRLPDIPIGTGPVPPAGGAVQIRYAGWMVDDGEPVVRVGDVWTPRLELQRHEGASPSDWFPHVEPDTTRGPTELQLDPEATVPATYRFSGDVITAQKTGVAAHWTAVEAAGVRFAVPAVHNGRLRGLGCLVHDTYMVDDDDVVAAITQPMLVERIQALRHVHRREGPDIVFAGYAAPVEVSTTRDRLTVSAGDHTFFIDVRPVG